MAIARATISKVSTAETVFNKKLTPNLVNIRVSPSNYFVAFFLMSFVAGFLFYLQKDLAALILFMLSGTVIPALAWRDRIVCDGKNVFRTGLIPYLWNIINARPQRLKISQIEQIETQALRALKRGGNVFYWYRTSVQGKGLRYVFASGGEDYRQMVSKLFASVSQDVLDNRSLELRDYLTDPKEVLMKAEFARIPSMEVLENSVNEFQTADRMLKSKRTQKEISSDEAQFAEELRQLANELRVSGNLLQSLETFRRALLLNPNSAWLIYDFARCLHSYAGMEKSKKLIRKANAALRLAELKAGSDGILLARIGETQFQYGNWRRASKTFYKTLSVATESFRSVRGLAEIALREGKIAHVIHHFSSAANFAANPALKRWALGENKYFTRLNSNDDYMDNEVTRINWLEGIERKKKSALRFSFVGLLVILVGLLIDDTVANFGWAFSFITITLWIGLIFSQGLFSERSPYFETEE